MQSLFSLIVTITGWGVHLSDTGRILLERSRLNDADNLQFKEPQV